MSDKGFQAKFEEFSGTSESVGFKTYYPPSKFSSRTRCELGGDFVVVHADFPPKQTNPEKGLMRYLRSAPQHKIDPKPDRPYSTNSEELRKWATGFVLDISGLFPNLFSRLEESSQREYATNNLIRLWEKVQIFGPDFCMSTIGETILAESTREGDLVSVSFLLMKGANPYLEDGFGRSAIFQAQVSRCPRMRSVYLNNGIELGDVSTKSSPFEG